MTLTLITPRQEQQMHRRSWTALALAGLTFVGTIGADEAHASKALTLTGTTVINAPTSGWVDVVLRDDATLSLKQLHNPDTAVDGEGRFLELTITGLGDLTDGLDVVRTPSWLGTQVLTTGSTDGPMTCSNPDVGPTPIAGPTQCGYTRKATKIVLHEGYYRLAVLTDNAPVQFTLQLHGLADGSTTVTPSHRLASVQKDLPASDSLPDKLVTFGTTAHLPGGFPAVIATLVNAAPDPTYKESSTCVRQDGTPPPPFAYGPSCPNGADGEYDYWVNVPVANQRTGGFGVFFTAAGGGSADYGIGGSYGNSTSVQLLHALGVWMQPVPMP